MPPLLPGRFAARVDEDIDPYKRTQIRTALVGAAIGRPQTARHP